MKKLIVMLSLIIMLSPITLDAAKGGKPKTCDWDVYYSCIADGWDRLYCLSQCMR